MASKVLLPQLKNPNARPLFDQLFDDLADGLEEESNIVKKSYNPYAKYGNDILAFCEAEFEEVYTDDVKEVMRSVEKYPVTIAKSANSTGKTHGAARIIGAFYKMYDDAQVFIAAAPPEDNLRKLLWGQVSTLIQRYPNLFRTDRISDLNIRDRERPGEHLVTGVTIPQQGDEHERKARFSGKHAPHMLFVIDEADAIPAEIFEAIESCMTGGWARLLCMFNPRAAQGPLYIKERDRKANIVHLTAFRHPNVVTGLDLMVGAVDRDTTARRIIEWTRELTQSESPHDVLGNLKEGVFMVPDFFEGFVAKSLAGIEYEPLHATWRIVTEPSFSYMVLGEYPSQAETSLISRMWINNARSRWDAYTAVHGKNPPIGTTCIMGQDVGEYGPDASVACGRWGGYVAELVCWGGVDPEITAINCAKIAREWNARAINVDGTGVGAGVAPYLERRDVNANRVMVSASPEEGSVESELGKFKILRDQLMWAVREWLRADPGSMLPPDENLIEELATPTYKVDAGKIRVMPKKIMRDLLRRSPDRMDALMLTFYSGVQYGPMKQFNYFNDGTDRKRVDEYGIDNGIRRHN